ncbi:uncharacterized protein LOC125114969 [Phacochoerus africanus]|uniref:uncharacterized protein LOC125114969 n=1 Tax=Phacochoerus africanus TaxID=41426 RepID=UPI001FD8AF03|nr:uncharacterized protein LOC125114969 [Phacochoerus africanus]
MRTGALSHRPWRGGEGAGAGGSGSGLEELGLVEALGYLCASEASRGTLAQRLRPWGPLLRLPCRALAAHSWQPLLRSLLLEGGARAGAGGARAVAGCLPPRAEGQLLVGAEVLDIWTCLQAPGEDRALWSPTWHCASQPGVASRGEEAPGTITPTQNLEVVCPSPRNPTARVPVLASLLGKTRGQDAGERAGRWLSVTCQGSEGRALGSASQVLLFICWVLGGNSVF